MQASKRKVVSPASVPIKDYFEVKNDLPAERIYSLKTEMNLKFETIRNEIKALDKKTGILLWGLGFLTVLISIYNFIK